MTPVEFHPAVTPTFVSWSTVWIEAIALISVVQVVSYLHWIANAVFKLDVQARRSVSPVEVAAYLVGPARLTLLDMKIGTSFPNVRRGG